MVNRSFFNFHILAALYTHHLDALAKATRYRTCDLFVTTVKDQTTVTPLSRMASSLTADGSFLTTRVLYKCDINVEFVGSFHAIVPLQVCP